MRVSNGSKRVSVGDSPASIGRTAISICSLGSDIYIQVRLDKAGRSTIHD
ncbi:MAG: hypothetical protein WCB68_24270 [Pyrinomonadaceae bacterium]